METIWTRCSGSLVQSYTIDVLRVIKDVKVFCRSRVSGSRERIITFPWVWDTQQFKVLEDEQHPEESESSKGRSSMEEHLLSTPPLYKAQLRPTLELSRSLLFQKVK